MRLGVEFESGGTGLAVSAPEPDDAESCGAFNPLFEEQTRINTPCGESTSLDASNNLAVSLV